MIDGDAVVHEQVLPAPAEQVFAMFTDPRRARKFSVFRRDERATSAIHPARRTKIR